MVLLTISLAATLTLLVLAVYAARRARLDPVARSLALLTADLAVWNLGATLHAATLEPAWHWLDVSFSPLTAPLVLQLVLDYVGRARKHRVALRLAWSFFTLLALASATSWFSAWGRAFIHSPSWSILYLAGWLPIFVTSLWLLAREVRRLRDSPLSAMRARLLLAALVLAGTLGSTELWNDLFSVPGLGAVGVAAAASLMAAVVFRFELIARERVAVAVYLGLVLLVGAVVLGAIVTASRGHAFATSLAAVFMLGLLLLIARELVQSFAEARAKTVELASLGRFTAQMSHDLKNPLAAMKGAVQYLQGADSQEPAMLELLAAQIARLETILERYGRLATTTLEKVPLDVFELASEVVRARLVGTPFAFEAHDTRTDRRPIAGDRDLLASVFENLVSNAVLAMGDKGRLTLTVQDRAGMTRVALTDTGSGIEPRHLERVTDDFYTTRADGSGLGLAFVRRIALAHGGRLAIESELGQGTTVTLELPSPRANA